MNLKKLEEISRIATRESSIALSRIVGGPVSVGVHYVEMKKTSDIFRMLEPETLVVVIYHSLVGAVSGTVALVLPKEAALIIADLMLKRERGTTQGLTDEVKAALEELGNIVVGNYLRSFSRQLGLRDALHRVGRLDFGTIESVAEKLAKVTLPEEGTLVAIVFGFQETTVKGYVVILLETQTLEKAGGGGHLT